ncbi:protein-L-isoaspartate(D-aspartate) O-methyltransferase [Methylophaga nitratireducenticrescens]|uniref:Protein-L-isoaspartate O-methyltransferase n=1 Tax=Methylophaga nitratireducenticrescens TaxID=754476 RepID=I1XHB4_METNJ|nr:protein-L-isoaspartate(D-aspartate) O-methyltransferase [Methylophaga nitratireducenticrescens]AFI83783.1 protein-L-isoaspartate O-methyltransferase [Methylophaga nitratireducenticrescens]AUZ83908.1 protein-L-isoaspartate O-methyltransferase [Methylophaga nitratireducenticrescens]
MNMGYISSTATGILLLILWSIGLSPNLVLAADDFQQQREGLIEQIRDDVRTSSVVLGKSRLDDNVLKAMATVPRHEFVPEKHRHQSYRNRPLPIGYGQTISQPAIVAMMTDLLQLESTDKALEIGTGSGYQAAILAELVEQVFSIEIVPELAERAAVDLERTGYLNVTTREGDGYFGWEEEAPFDAIIVTAASDHIPPPLLKQLKPGGRMVIPVGSRFMVQHLVLVTKDADDNIVTEQLLPVRFVPLTSQR